MNSKFAGTIAAILLMSGAASADEVVQLGPVGGRASVSFVKRDPEKKSVAANGGRSGVAGSSRADKGPVKLIPHTQSINNGTTITYYTESR